MDFSGIPLFSLMKMKLDYLSQRQGLLSQNIANADTPGYKAKDLVEPDFNRLLQQNATKAAPLALATTSANHINPQFSERQGFKVIKRPTTDELKPSGSNVTIEEEVAKVAKNQAEYQKVLNLYSKSIALFKTAIGNTSGTG